MRNMASYAMKNQSGSRRFSSIYAVLATLLLLVVSGCGHADTKNVRHVRTIKAPYDISWIAWHPNGEELAGGGNFNKAVTIWNTRTGEVVREIAGDDGGVASLAYSPDGRYLAVGRGFTRVTREHVHLSIYDAKTGALVQRFSPETPRSGTSNDVSAVVFSPDGRYVVASAYVGGQTAVVYDVLTGKVVTTLPAGEGRHTINSLAYSPDGKYIVVGKTTGANIPDGTHSGTIDVIATGDWSLVRTTKAYEMGVHALSFCGDSRFFVSGTDPGGLRYYKPNKQIITIKDTKPIKVWATKSSTPLAELSSELAGTMTSVGCSPDGKTLFVGGRDKAVEIWDVPTERRLEWLEGFGVNAYIKASPVGKSFAVASKKTVDIWELNR